MPHVSVDKLFRKCLISGLLQLTSAEGQQVFVVRMSGATSRPTPRTPPATDPPGSGRPRRWGTPPDRGSPVGSSSWGGWQEWYPFLFYTNTINLTFLVLNKGKLDIIISSLTVLATRQKFLLKKISTVVYHLVKELRKCPDGGKLDCSSKIFLLKTVCKQNCKSCQTLNVWMDDTERQRSSEVIYVDRNIFIE